MMTHDVIFEVGIERKEISAHKAILGISSDAFNAMLNGPWIENGQKKIRIPEMEPEVFAELINFIYKGSCDITIENVVSLMDAGTQYQIATLAPECKVFLMKSLDYNESNALMCFYASKIYKCESLEIAALHIISRNIDRIIKSNEFLELSADRLNEILSSDSFAVTELKVFDALMSWGKAECSRKNLEPNDGENIRQCVLPSLYLVRFPLMKSIEVHSIMSKMPNILTSEEMCPLYEYFALKDNSEWIPKETFFSSIPRKACDYNVVFYKERGTEFGETHSYAIKGHRNYFRVNKRINLISLGFYGSPVQDDVFNIKVKIYEKGGTEALYSQETLKFAEKNTTFYLNLEKSLKIKKNTWYGITFAMEGPETIYGKVIENAVHRVTCGPFGVVEFLYEPHSYNLPELVFTMDKTKHAQDQAQECVFVKL